MTKMKIDVLYQFNEKYAPYAGVSLTSLFENNLHFEEIRVFILGEDLSERSMQRFRILAARYNRKLAFIDTRSLISMMKKLKMPAYRGSYAANMRLFLTYILDEDVNRLLYLDADTIVDGKLDELAEMPMEGHPLAMSLDSLVRRHKKRLGFSREDFYYNSGVILFSMPEWRSGRCSERIANHVRNVRAWYPSPDQDLLNVVLKGEILKLSPAFNIEPVYLAFSLRDYYSTFGARGFYTVQELKHALNFPVIYHFFRFIGEFPWDKNNVHPDNDIFDHYLAISPWNDYMKTASAKSLIFKLEKGMYRLLPGAVFIRIFRIAYERFIRKANSDSLKFKTNRNM